MEKGALKNQQVEQLEGYFRGKDFVEAVAHARDKAELKELLCKGGITGFEDELLEECWPALALSQDQDALAEIFQDPDFAGCRAKLAAHGLTVSREEFDLISQILAMAQDAEYIRKLMAIKTAPELYAELQAGGYTAVTPEFLASLQENAVSLVEDGILDPAALQGEEQPLYKRWFHAINRLFAMCTITELSLGIAGAIEPAYLIAIACGICQMG